jgi:hypothetical protein
MQLQEIVADALVLRVPVEAAAARYRNRLAPEKADILPRPACLFPPDGHVAHALPRDDGPAACDSRAMTVFCRHIVKGKRITSIRTE